MRVTPLVIEQPEEIRQAFRSGRCDACTHGASSLAGFRAAEGPDGEQHVLLTEIISSEPLGAVVRCSHFAMATAEEPGITSRSIDQFIGSPKPDVQRLLGRSGDFGRPMGVDNTGAARNIRRIGSFGECRERNITPRGMKALWTEGGPRYAPPIG